MSIGSILLGFGLLVLVALFLARPFLVPQLKQRNMTRRQALLAQKEAVLDQIRSVDFDHDTEKLPEEVYQAQRAQLTSEAAVLLKRLDEMGATQPASSGEKPAWSAVDGEIEAAIARMRQTISAGIQPAGIAGFCTHCGTPFDPGDKFCARCGHKLPQAQPTL